MQKLPNLKKLLLLFLSLAFFLEATPEEWDRRFQAHVIIKDYRTAVSELQIALQIYPHSSLLWEDYIQALGLKGDEKGLFQAWKRYTLLFPEKQNNRDLIENMAWAVIQEGVNSSSPMIRIYAILAAFFGNSAKGVDILAEGLHDQNSFIRIVSADLSGKLRDDKLKEAILLQLQKERDYTVRGVLIESLGSMKVKAATPLLLKIARDNSLTMEERGLAVSALSSMTEQLERSEAEKLTKDPHAGLRLLAAQLIIQLEKNDYADLLLQLGSDSVPDIRGLALQGLGLLNLSPEYRERTLQLARIRSKDKNDLCAISACWLLTLLSPEEGQVAFMPWLESDSKESQALAGAALAVTGSKGISLIQKVFPTVKDPFLKLNFAKGLITQNVDTLLACDAIYDTMMENQQQWMVENKGLFEVLCLSRLKQTSGIPNEPEIKNQLVRLELLNMLATRHYPKAQEAFKTFLNQRHWGVTGLASALLLTEGDDASVNMIKGLLNDSIPNVRLQAALILALWGRDEAAISILKQSYATASRERKEQILESLGRIGDSSVIPFLIEKMQEPSQSLRLIAAVALIQTLNG